MILEVAISDRQLEGDFVLKDIGDGLPFRPGTFDGAIRCVMVKHLDILTKLI